MTPLPKPPTGDSPFVTWCRVIAQCIRERTILAGDNVTLNAEANGTRINGTAKGKPGTVTQESATLQRFKIIELFPDYVVGKKINNDLSFDGTEEIAIAKPKHVRQSHQNAPAGFTAANSATGRTLTYVGSPSGDLVSGMTVIELMLPSYGLNETDCYAMEVTGGTSLLDSSSAPITWLEISPVRFYRPQYLGTTVCINGVQRRVIVAGGPLGAIVP